MYKKILIKLKIYLKLILIILSTRSNFNKRVLVKIMNFILKLNHQRQNLDEHRPKNDLS